MPVLAAPLVIVVEIVEVEVVVAVVGVVVVVVGAMVVVVAVVVVGTALTQFAMLTELEVSAARPLPRALCSPCRSKLR